MNWSILALVALGLVFFIGWGTNLGEQPAKPGESHLWGLKFAPACQPQGIDALCGMDVLIIIPILALVYLILFGPLKADAK